MKKDYSRPDVKIDMYKAEDVVAASAVTIKPLGKPESFEAKYTLGKLKY